MLSKRNFFIFGLGALYLYLGYHALSGEQGGLSWARYNAEIESLQTEIADLQAQNEVLERQAKALKASNLDLDLLDERARYFLNHRGENEIIVVLDQ